MCVLGYSLGYSRHGSLWSNRARLTVEFFTHTVEQWNDIRTVVRDALGLDAEFTRLASLLANSRSLQALGE
jgi:hypothetical protein